MMMKHSLLLGVALVLLLTFFQFSLGHAKEELPKAVAAMRGINPAFLNEEQKKRKFEELDQALKTLVDAGVSGAQILKEELRKLQARKEHDDLFTLGAAAVLWQIGGVSEAETIAGIWSSGIDLAVNYSYVFFTAFEAARTQDPQVLPMFSAILRDHEGSVFIPQHYLEIRWPLSHAFIWGAFGSKGAWVFEGLLSEPVDDNTLGSAVVLLSGFRG